MRVNELASRLPEYGENNVCLTIVIKGEKYKKIRPSVRNINNVRIDLVFNLIVNTIIKNTAIKRPRTALLLAETNIKKETKHINTMFNIFFPLFTAIE